MEIPTRTLLVKIVVEISVEEDLHSISISVWKGSGGEWSKQGLRKLEKHCLLFIYNMTAHYIEKPNNSKVRIRSGTVCIDYNTWLNHQLPRPFESAENNAGRWNLGKQ